MIRGPFYQEKYKPQFSGHETFPLRYGWLKKVFDAIYESENSGHNKSIFLDKDAIARFGVGKNMVSSMRHWANAVGIIKDTPETNGISATELGKKIFSYDGLDPFLEHPSTLWLIHWQLCGHHEKTTWYWAFNCFANEMFDRETLVNGLASLAKERNWTRVAVSTLKRDVECFVRTYVVRPSNTKSVHEDTLESPLAELGLIKPVGKRDGFRMVRGRKSSLGHGVFLYALLDFCKNNMNSSTLSFEKIAHEPGSPGRVFLLDENHLIDYLVNIGDVTNGAYRWSETAGLKQVIRENTLSKQDTLNLIDLDYTAP